MNILNGIQNFLSFIDSNWTNILIILGLLLSIGNKVKTYLSKSYEEKINIAKAQVHETILKMITEAEVDYELWNKAGEIKRAQVIEAIFIAYPILSKVVNQNELIEWIDEEINNALKVLRKVIKENKEETKTETQ